MKKNIGLQYLNQVLMLIPGNVYWKDRNGRYLGCNHQQLRVAKVKLLEDIIGKTDDELFSREVASRIMNTDKEIIEKRLDRTLEEIGVDSEGKEVIYLSKKSPLYDEFGQVVGLVGIGVDITEKKQAEKSMIQAKTEFLENMRHDIRTPLSGIVGCAQLIQMQAYNPKKVAVYAEDLVQSSDALLEFLNKILESIKVATGEIPRLKQTFDLHQMLEQAVHLNKPQADVKHLSLHLNYDKTIPAYLLGDPIRIQRIILELLTNALKFTDKGEINLSARLMKNKTSTGKMIIELSVRDTGMGIPREKQNEIYTRFKRLTPSYQGVYPGTGLGLSVVKQFIDDLGGEIQLDSQRNEGSTFKCFIPLHESLSTIDESKKEGIQSFEAIVT